MTTANQARHDQGPARAPCVPGAAPRPSRPGRLWRILATLLVVMLLLVGVGGGLLSRSATSTVGRVAFTDPLLIPPLAASTVDHDGSRTFGLTAQTGEHNFGRGRTRTSGYNGTYLGPTLRVARGEKVRVQIHNLMSDPTTVHWHGMHLPAAADGGPGSPILPRRTTSVSWQVRQPAATLWYHPHPDDHTEDQVYAGLAGMVIVDDPAANTSALPHTYGVDDIPVIVQDKSFDRDGQFTVDNPLGGTLGILGDTLLVNGTIGPYQEVTSSLVRLRLLNGSGMRSYNFGFSDDRRFALIGIDSGLQAVPHTMDRIALSPGERAEIVVAMRPAERVTLRSYPPEPDAGLVVRAYQGGGDAFDVLQLRAAGQLSTTTSIPARLASEPDLDPGNATYRRFDLSLRRINGRKLDMDWADVVAVRDVTERWTVYNADFLSHNFHVHGVRFQVYRFNGKAPPAHLRGWKDTVHLAPGDAFDLLLRFTDYADPTTPYMYHCHLLKHEDSGMMGQIVVVAPGQVPQLSSSNHQHN